MTLRLIRFAAPLAGIAAAVAGAGALAQDNPALPDGPGKTELLGACTACHAVDQIIAQRRSPDDWAGVITTMVGYGAEVTPAQQSAILAYLNTNYGTGAAAAASGGTPASGAPASGATPTPGQPSPTPTPSQTPATTAPGQI